MGSPTRSHRPCLLARGVVAAGLFALLATVAPHNAAAGAATGTPGSRRSAVTHSPVSVSVECASEAVRIGDSIVATATVHNFSAEDTVAPLTMRLYADIEGSYVVGSNIVTETSMRVAVPSGGESGVRVVYPRSVYRDNGRFDLVAEAAGSRGVRRVTVGAGLSIRASFPASSTTPGTRVMLVIDVTNELDTPQFGVPVVVYGEPAWGGPGPAVAVLGAVGPHRTETLLLPLVFEYEGDEGVDVFAAHEASGLVRAAVWMAVRGPARLRASLDVPQGVVVGRRVSIRATVSNEGGAAARGVTALLSVPGGLRAEAPLAVNVRDLAPGESREVEWPVMVTAEGRNTVSLVAWDADGNRSSEDWDALRTPGADLTVRPAEATARPGTTATYLLRVGNRDAVGRSFQVTVDGVPGFCGVSVPEMVQVGPGAERFVTMRVSAPRSAATEPGIYPVTVRIVAPECSAVASTTLRVER